MLVEAILAAAILLLEYVEDLLGVHATEADIVAAHTLAIVSAREGDDLLVRVHVHNHQVDDVIHSYVGETWVFLVQLGPRSQMP